METPLKSLVAKEEKRIDIVRDRFLCYELSALITYREITYHNGNKNFENIEITKLRVTYNGAVEVTDYRHEKAFTAYLIETYLTSLNTPP